MNNLVEFQVLEIENINSSIEELEGKTLCKFIMNLRVDNDQRVFITIKKSQQGDYVL